MKKSAIAVAGASIASSLPRTLHGALAPSDRLDIAVIGLGFGNTNIHILMEADQSVHCAAMCDVDEVRLAERSTGIIEKFPDRTKDMKLHTDFRKVLDDKDIDGVIIATPDHWHAYIYAEACKAGKAVYVEKPVGRTVAECEMMIGMQRKYNTVVSTGLWHASLDYFVEAFDILKTGILGDVYKVHAWISGGTSPVRFGTEPEEVPDTLDYKRWLGPAPSRPYNYYRVHKWREFWDYSGGRQTDWVHYLDSALDGIAALGIERTYPKSVYSVGYKHPDTMTETPAMQTSVFQFDDVHIVWEHSIRGLYDRGDGVAWIGSKGTLVCNRTGYEFIHTSGPKPEVPILKKGRYGNQFNHVANWADCIRNKNPKTNSMIDKAAYATILANIANISYRLGGQSLEYLPDEKTFRNNPEADTFIVPEYYNGWEFPKV